jgi:hypothetical protein
MFWSRIGAGIVPLISRSNEPEVELPAAETVFNDTEDYDEEQYLHPVDVTYHDSKTESVSPVAELTLTPETPVAQTANDHITHSDVPRPQSPIYDRDGDDAASLTDEERKRISVDSDYSVYEEANADVDLEVDPNTPKHDPAVPSITHSQEPDTDLAKAQ